MFVGNLVKSKLKFNSYTWRFFEWLITLNHKNLGCTYKIKGCCLSKCIGNGILCVCVCVWGGGAGGGGELPKHIPGPI
jgi:hypothetical protein